MLNRPRRARLATAAALLAAGAAALPAAAPAAAKPKPPTTTDVLLSLQHGPGLAAFVRSVSDPASSRYRRYATVEQLTKRFGAPAKTRSAVTAWVRARGLRAEVGPTGTYVLASGSPTRIRSAFGAVAATRGTARTAGVPVALPAALRDAGVDGAALLSPIPGLRPAADAAPPVQTPSFLPRTGTPAGCPAGQSAGRPDNPGFTPDQFLGAYGIDRMHERGFTGQGKRIALIEIDGYKTADLQVYAECFGRKVPKISSRPYGMKALPAPGDETTLDIQTLMAALPDLPRIDIYANPGNQSGLLRATAAAIADPKRRPDAISISLTQCEAALAGDIVDQRALDDVFAFAAGAGISVLVASGDDGITACAGDVPDAIVAVNTPASSAYVTAVGGTNVELTAANRLKRQISWNDAPVQLAGSGGGQSILVDRPWWQQSVLPLGFTNDITRGVPDIAALADLLPGYAIFCTAEVAICQQTPGGGWIQIGGTSVATPLMTSSVVLSGQEAARHGQPPLGFVNPLIYALGGGKTYHRVMDDVTVGSNDMGLAIPAAFGGGKPFGGYEAGPGYDYVTGWGSLKTEPFSAAARTAYARAASGRKPAFTGRGGRR